MVSVWGFCMVQQEQGVLHSLQLRTSSMGFLYGECCRLHAECGLGSMLHAEDEEC